MKKGLLSILVLICCATVFSGCLKNGTDRSVQGVMTADIGSYSFNASYTEPATITPQLNDSSTTLIVTGTENSTGNKITVSIVKYKNAPGSYSIVDKKASGSYYTNGASDIAASGVVTIKDVSSNAITGYFTLTTLTGITITNGTFTVVKPWSY